MAFSLRKLNPLAGIMESVMEVIVNVDKAHLALADGHTSESLG